MLFIEIVALQIGASEIYIHLRFPFVENFRFTFAENFKAWKNLLDDDYAFQPGDLNNYFWHVVSCLHPEPKSNSIAITRTPNIDNEDNDIIPF